MTGKQNEAYETDGGADNYGNRNTDDTMGDITVTIKDPGDVNIDMIDRDPTRMNDHIRVSFEDIFAEPDGTHSSDKIWALSYKTFTKTKACCYGVFSTICGVPCAFCWGIMFAFTFFCQIWYIIPNIRLLSVNLWAVHKMQVLYLHAYCDPLFESCGRCFSQIKVHTTRD